MTEQPRPERLRSLQMGMELSFLACAVKAWPALRDFAAHRWAQQEGHSGNWKGSPEKGRHSHARLFPRGSTAARSDSSQALSDHTRAKPREAVGLLKTSCMVDEDGAPSVQAEEYTIPSLQGGCF